MTENRPWVQWSSGFLAAVGALHTLPLIVREDVILAGVQLTTTATLITAVVCFVASAVTWKLAHK